MITFKNIKVWLGSKHFEIFVNICQWIFIFILYFYLSILLIHVLNFIFRMLMKITKDSNCDLGQKGVFFCTFRVARSEPPRFRIFLLKFRMPIETNRKFSFLNPDVFFKLPDANSNLYTWFIFKAEQICQIRRIRPKSRRLAVLDTFNAA